MDGDLLLVIGILLLACGAAGTLVSIWLVLAFAWDVAVALALIAASVGVVGALLIGSNE
ncbi:hypothetical protein [Rhodococcus sp. ACT016]|uniref:hypothetical protein n=1 Tax=Rhodococcus sp. ACT016 TaxID=3134808 RepID=UPI003D2E100C